MFGTLGWKIVGLTILLALVVAVVLVLTHTSIVSLTHPFMAPICPGSPDCG
jgi:hypothetical protein